MKKLIMVAALLCTNAYAAESPYLYLTIGSDATSTTQKTFSNVKTITKSGEISVIKIHKDKIVNLSKLMHDKFNRCGGFIVHESKQEAMKVASNHEIRKTAKNFDMFSDYSIDQEVTVKTMVSMVKEINIRKTIEKLSSFHNRYYKAQTGVDSQTYVKKTWETIAQGRTDVSVEYFKHSNFPQPSVVLTIEGSTKAEEIVILGGHADSIAGYWSREKARAPGADDNASGIATLTEILKVAMTQGYKPQRTIKFMAYAAEEVGLLGSKAIADSFKKAGKKVIGVVQFDMTNHNGSRALDIVFMNDFTNAAQNKFMGKLVDTYVHVPWGFSKCGYGCSDHASWHNAGYPASMPFESTMGDINKHIHKATDTISQSRSNANHAEKFAKLGVAFMVEMGK